MSTLALPIVLARLLTFPNVLVTSHQAHILDERFSYALLCLERLVDYHGRGRGLSRRLESLIDHQLTFNFVDCM